MKNRERLFKIEKRENGGIWRSLLRDNDGIWGTIEKRVFSSVFFCFMKLFTRTV
jgi:hypothetical protein